MLTPEAKRFLGETIRGTPQDPEKGLRATLLRKIRDEADRVYRLSLPMRDAKLAEAPRIQRQRLEARLDERARATRAKSPKELKAARERLLREAEKEAAATLLNRLVFLRLLEAQGLSKPAVLAGGWNSKGYREFREFAPALCTNGASDATEGYATLLQLVFDELSIDLPGLYGDVGLTRLFPVPASALREVVERLDDARLESAWTDDTTLGWVYQYWNDPDREALDAKIKDGGKIEPHEIASKTQMFTERYMVEWLLQNSLGLTWLAMCKKRGWTADAERVLPLLDARRAEWRRKREAGEVALDALMPIESELEEHWKYYVPQPLPDDAVLKAPESVRAIKILDPACGSGHFLVIAFGLLAALYREEARQCGTTVAEREIAESILENNLHGIDIDPRAVQIAAAALYLRAKTLAKDARPRTLHLVAPALQLGNLPADDPAVVLLREELEREAGLPAKLTNKVLAALAGVDYLGSLLEVDAAVESAVRSAELEAEHVQGHLFGGFPAQQVKLSLGEAKATFLDKLERFLEAHSRTEDLGLRLDGEQLAAGVRFIRLAREGTYDLVVGNPPYQGLSKTQSFGYVVTTYPRGKADLYAAFLERALEFARPGGMSALLTMRGWMFVGQYAELRRHLLHHCDLRALGDLDKGAFETMTTSQLISVAMTIFRASRPSEHAAVALQPTAPGEKYWGPDRTDLKRAAILAQRGRYEFDPHGFEVIEGEPLVYWWSSEFLAEYAAAPKLGHIARARKGLCTGDDTRFTRFWWEVARGSIHLIRCGQGGTPEDTTWAPAIRGGKGRVWFEPLVDVVRYEARGLELQVMGEQPGTGTRFQNGSCFFRPGVAFAMIGAGFNARAHRYRSVFGNMGSSVFPQGIPRTLCLMNSATARFVLESLNPGVHFEVGDVNRLPTFQIKCAEEIFERLEDAFSGHESARESSVEFRCPGASAWAYAQDWAQRAVDRSAGDPLPRYEPVSQPARPQSLVSFAVGIALGRFGDGERRHDTAPPTALPSGILFVGSEGGDSLDHPACRPLFDAWKEHGEAVGGGADPRAYLRGSFFDYHKKLYENRPIYFPLSSAKKSFVAFVSIHRWADDTLSALLADHLVPTRRRLEGELEDLRVARVSGGNKGRAERRFTEVQKLLEELNDFIAKVTETAEKGPPPPDDKTEKRELDARYVMDLDDGVMVNSAALWPLLEPQWKDPKKWWKELANAQGKKDYDWSHLAARYFPTRVQAKCHHDPSLAVAHKCFWELHPAKAYAWELRLQDEIRPDFTIDEPGSDEARATFLRERAPEADEIHAKEKKRRQKKKAQADEEGESGELFEDDAEETEVEADA